MSWKMANVWSAKSLERQMSGRQMSQTAKYQGAKCLGREMSLPPIVWGTYCPGSQISGRQMSKRQLSGADWRAPNVRQPLLMSNCPSKRQKEEFKYMLPLLFNVWKKRAQIKPVELVQFDRLTKFKLD